MNYYILKQDTFNGEKMSSYSFFKSNSNNIYKLVDILTDCYDGNRIRKYIFDDNCGGFGNNMITIDKKGNMLEFSSDYDEDDPKFIFSLSRDTFLKVLDQWDQAYSENLEYIVIEVSDDNEVTIYATDTLDRH